MKRILLTAVLGLLATAAAAQSEPYKNPALAPEVRAEDLLNRLTLDEKIGLMKDVSLPVERLGIPAYNWWSEALHGVGRAGLATVFPQSIGMAASFDDELVRRAFDAVSDEARAKFHEARRNDAHKRYWGLTFWTPNINIFRDPRWGRGQETYGEDPYLTTRMGLAVVRGLQGPDTARFGKLHACAKHFAVHSGPEWNRHSFDAREVDARDLWETYLPAFKALVQEGNVQEVMCAYNRYEGEPCCGSNRLLHTILRELWGYRGIVVSDCGAIDDFYKEGHHETHRDAAHASADAVLTGTDVECGKNYVNLGLAVEQGLITEEQIDVSVRRLLRARFALGELDDDSAVAWSRLTPEVIDCPEHRALALRMARETMVLLQNRNGILPLRREDAARIVVMGPNAADSVMQWGNYNGFPSHTATVLEAIRAKLGDEMRYVAGCGLIDDRIPDVPSEQTRLLRGKKVRHHAMTVVEAVEAAGDAEYVIFVGGVSPAIEGEEMKVDYPGFRRGDRTDIELPAVQRDLLTALHRAGKRIVYVNCSGSAVALEPETQTCEAILQAWYPGQAGGTAVADVLFGDYNPAGRLPVTFYKNLAQLPDFENYSMRGRTYRYFRDEPLFPFGYGLSYTTFAYGKAKLSSRRIGASESVRLTVDLRNIGPRDGEEVVQIYIRRDDDTDGPTKSLRAFRRVAVGAGERTKVTFELDAAAFETFDPATATIRTLAGDYTIYYGGSSATERTLKIRLL
ncbi:MAG: glycoside hydrolase family 3 C-terminal domain-containing protein [Alistipes senegalensis]|nr:glycoside hydrolase family 3 C-terminal domain-containing protein [Bacteroides cellulosilyticus]MCM1351207.1 glycoside hydrolase family 3 C-terminal domain-containing protein [Alistipes senegalensis]